MAPRASYCLTLVWLLAGGAVVGAQNGTEGETLKVVGIDFSYVAQPIIITSFLLVTAVILIAYHHSGPVAEYFPETCLLILVGLAFAGIFKASGQLAGFRLDERQFMLFYLPPIVTDAAYQLYSKTFTSNVGTILLFAVVGTLLNLFFIGGCLYGLSAANLMGGAEFTGIDAFLYASLVIAVDPVAVIAIFKEVGVNERLYFLVFGESLFNDAVTIVVFDLMISFTYVTNITASDFGVAVGAFLTDSIGAALVGLFVGVLSAFVTRFTKGMPVVQPIALYTFAYWAYLLCELFTWSGIIGLTMCCITQAWLAFPYLTRNSRSTLLTGASAAGTIVESLLFVFMGAEIIESDHQWNGLFVLWVVLLCLVGRLISVYGLNAAADPFRKAKIPLKERFVMWWAGLRGALAFALCTTISQGYQFRSMFLTTTLLFILFTVFIMGIGMRPWVKRLKIEMKKDTAELEDVNIGAGTANEHTDEPDLLLKYFNDGYSRIQRMFSKNHVERGEDTSKDALHLEEVSGGVATEKNPPTEVYTKADKYTEDSTSTSKNLGVENKGVTLDDCAPCSSTDYGATSKSIISVEID